MKIVFLIAFCITLVPKTSNIEGSINSTNDNLEDYKEIFGDIHNLKLRSTDPGYKKAAVQLIVVTICAVWIILLNLFFCFKYYRERPTFIDLELNSTLAKEHSSQSDHRSIVSLVNAEFKDETGLSMEEQPDSISSTGIQSTDSVCRTLRKGYSPIKSHSKSEKHRKDDYSSLHDDLSADEEEWCYKNVFAFKSSKENGLGASSSPIGNSTLHSDNQLKHRPSIKKNSSKSLESFFDSRRKLNKLYPLEGNRSLNAIQTNSLIEKVRSSDRDEDMTEKSQSSFKYKCKSAWKNVKRKFTPSSYSFRRKNGSYELVPS